MTHWLHSESIVKTQLKHYDLKVVKIPFYFLRVRHNGEIAGQDYRPSGGPLVPLCDPDERCTALRQTCMRKMRANCRSRRKEA